MSDAEAWGVACIFAIAAICLVPVALSAWHRRPRMLNPSLKAAFQAIVADTVEKAPPGSGTQNRWRGTGEHQGRRFRWAITTSLEEIDDE